MGQYFVHQQGSAVGHAPRPTARTKAALFAAEGHQAFRVTAVTTQPQETVLEATAFEVRLELLADVIWQHPTLKRPLRLKSRVVLFDKLVKKRPFRAMALVHGRANTRTGFPASRQRQHDRILAKSSCPSD
jgi:hypothetical protein